MNQNEDKSVNFMNTIQIIMEGILYVTDQNNKKKFAQIDLEKYGEQWEDFYDRLMVEMVQDEESISLEELGMELKEEGLINEL